MSNGTATEEPFPFTFPTAPLCWGLLAGVGVGAHFYWKYLKLHASLFRFDAEKEEARAGSWQPYDPDLLAVHPYTLRFKGKRMEREYVDARMDDAPELATKVYLSSLAFVSGLFPVLLDYHIAVAPSWFPITAALLNLVFSVAMVLSLAWMRRMLRWVQLLWIVQQISLTALDLYWAFTVDTNAHNAHTLDGELSALTYAMSISFLVFSGVFRWWTALLWSGLVFASSVAVWVVKGDACLKTLCDTGNYYSAAPWLYTRFLFWVICLIVSYELERRDRRLFRLRKELEQLGLCMGQMDTEAARRLLSDIGTAHEPVAILARLVVLVKNIERYRPFLPPGIFARDDDPPDEGRAAGAAAPPPSPSESVAATPTPASTPTSGPSLSGASGEWRQGADGGAGHAERPPLHRGLARRTGTLLLCRMETGPGLGPALEAQGAAFLRAVADAAARCQGVVQYFGCDLVIVAWNVFGNHPKHQSLACRCALDIAAQALPQEVAQAVVSGPCLSGLFGIDHLMAPVVHGPLPRVGARLLGLNRRLGSGIVVTEAVHEAVQAAFATVALDNVVPEGLPHSVKVYGLLPGPPHGALEDRAYKEGFSCLLQRRHDEAAAQFLAYCRHPDARGAVAVQARRLLAVARALSAAAGGFCRWDGWAPLAGDAEGVGLPPGPKAPGPPDVDAGPHGDEIRVLEAEIDALAHGDAHAAAELPGPPAPPEACAEPLHTRLAAPARRRSETQRHIRGRPFRSGNGEYWYISPALLGAGGFGAVYLGMSDAGMLVAIKKMPLAPDKAREMLHEIKVLSRYRHEHIVAYLGSAVLRLGGGGSPDAPDSPAGGPAAASESARGGAQPVNELLIVMEYVPCGSLAHVLEQFGRFPVTSVQRYARDILRGLRYLHAEGVLHRDIKPQNTLLEASGLCKLADFGTAALLGGGEAAAGEAGAVVGTAHYMAPELLRGGPATAGADVWAFGITCLQLLTGSLWMDATNAFAVLYALGTMEAAPEVPEDLPKEVREVLRVCLALELDARATAVGLLNMPFFL